MKKLIDRIRDGKTWRERARIAEDRFPGTPFDSLFQAAHQIVQDGQLGMTGNRDRGLMALGDWLKRVILKGDSKTLRKAAIALNDWKWHTPKPDYDLIALFTLADMFPPGRRPLLRWKGKTPVFGKRIKEPVAMRHIKKSIARMDPSFSEDEWERRKRRIQRYAREFRIPLDTRPGRHD